MDIIKAFINIKLLNFPEAKEEFKTTNLYYYFISYSNSLY